MPPHLAVFDIAYILKKHLFGAPFDMTNIHDVVVIGAGFSGVFTALKLAREGRKVLLLEAADEIIPTTSTSFNQCYKLHSGMHYLGDPATAELCLRNAVYFAKTYSSFLAGGSDLTSPMRRGRHYIMSNSLVGKEEALQTAERLQNAYQALCAQDAANQVFGDPEHFIQILPPEAYDYFAKEIPFIEKDGQETAIHIALGIETAESQIDIDRLKVHLSEEILYSDNIIFMPKTNVHRLAQAPDHLGYIVTVMDEQGQIQSIDAKNLVNCAWQNIELLDASFGRYIADDKQVNRLKVSIVLELPAALAKMHTSTFTCGPYASMTVLPNGHVILTSERSTNVAYYRSGPLEAFDEIKALLATLNLHHPKGLEIAQTIRRECAVYFEAYLAEQLMAAPIKEIRAGFVKLIDKQRKYNDQSLYEPDSIIHARSETGVVENGLGYFSNSGMKMTYTLANADDISHALRRHEHLYQQLLDLIQDVKMVLHPLPMDLEQLTPILDSLLYGHFRHYFYQFVMKPEACDEVSKPLIRVLSDMIIHHLREQHALMRALRERTAEQSLTVTVSDEPSPFALEPLNNERKPAISAYFFLEIMRSNAAQMIGSLFLVLGMLIMLTAVCPPMSVTAAFAGACMTSSGVLITSMGLFSQQKKTQLDNLECLALSS